MTKWMTSGARRLKHGLKANHDRSFGARRNKKGAAARLNDKGYESVVASAKIGESRRNNGECDLSMLVPGKLLPPYAVGRICCWSHGLDLFGLYFFSRGLFH